VALGIGLKQLNFALGLSGLAKHEGLFPNMYESLSHSYDAKWESMALYFPECKRLPSSITRAICLCTWIRC
jgi:hypothetical protein